MKRQREHLSRSLLAAALLAIASGPTWADDALQADEQYRRFLLSELRLNLKESIESLSLERADVIQRIAIQEAVAGERARRDDDARPVAPGWKSSGATL